jgi:transposase
MASVHRRTDEERARVLADWQASGVSATAFAPRAGVSAHTLYTWRRKARSEAGDASAGQFTELIVRSSPTSAATDPDARLEIALGEAVVRVGARFDDAHLRRVLDVVRTIG